MAAEPERGYRYSVTDEQIEEWLAVPLEEKLRWVEEMSRLSYELRSEEAREIAELLRAGII